MSKLSTEVDACVNIYCYAAQSADYNEYKFALVHPVSLLIPYKMNLKQWTKQTLDYWC